MISTVSLAAVMPASRWLLGHPNSMVALGLALGGVVAFFIYSWVRLVLVRVERQRSRKQA
jgi:hypothetical protein